MFVHYIDVCTDVCTGAYRCYNYSVVDLALFIRGFLNTDSTLCRYFFFILYFN